VITLASKCGHLHSMMNALCCREERLAQEAREKEEQEFELLMEMEEDKKKMQEHATEQVRKLKVSDSRQFFAYFFKFQKE